MFDVHRMRIEFYSLNHSIFILNSVRQSPSFYVYNVWSLVSSTRFEY